MLPYKNLPGEKDRRGFTDKSLENDTAAELSAECKKEKRIAAYQENLLEELLGEVNEQFNKYC